jgi:hypothetical protein
MRVSIAGPRRFLKTRCLDQIPLAAAFQVATRGKKESRTLVFGGSVIQGQRVQVKALVISITFRQRFIGEQIFLGPND